MKIRGILMAVTVLMGMAAAAGCNDESTSSISRVEKRNESSVAEVSTTLDESAEGSDSSSEGDSDTAQDTTEKSAAQKAREEAREQAAEIQETRSDEEQEAPAGDEDTQKTAEEMFKKSCDTFWDTLINCGYQLDEEDQSGEGVRVVDYDSVDAIKEIYTQVFLEPDPMIDEKYFEENGKLYCRDGARGADMYYRSTELMPVSVKENFAEYTAVSYFADPDTNEPMDKKLHDFKMMKVNGEWRTAEFTLPY